MAVSAQIPNNTYVTNGITTTFPYTFKITRASDLKVFVNDIEITTGFTLTGVGNDGGGSVVFSVAPIAGSCYIYRAMPISRDTDYITAGALEAETLNEDVDATVMMIQDLTYNVSRNFEDLTGKPTTLDGYGITDALKKTGDTMTGVLTLAAITPSGIYDATSKAYVDYYDSLKLDKAGDTMTGHLILPSSAVHNQYHAVQKYYVDNALDLKINKAGDTMTGFLTLHSNPTSPNHAVNKQYTDNLHILQLDKSGGTMTGMIVLPADAPTSPNHAVPKYYVDNSVATHSADETKHLTSAQNTWLDSITATAAQINFLTGTTSSVQTQLDSKLNLTGGTLSGSLRVNAPILSLNSLTVNSGTNNVAFGESSLRYNTTGTQNTAVGKWSLQNTTTGGYNVAVGAAAAIANTTGQLNTAIGGNTLYNNLTGSGNTAIGNSALFSSTGSNNIAVGYNALYSNTASGNLAVGNSALYYNTTGTQNVAIGTNGGLFNSGGIANTFIGLNSGMYNTVGYYNTALGNQAGYINATGYYNTSIGFNAGNTATTTGGTTYSSVTVTSGVSNNNLGLTSGGLIQVQAQTTNGGFVSGSWYIFWHNGTNVVQYGGTLSGTTDFITNGAMNWSNTSSIGNNSQVSGNHQVQLGDASTTTYVYGTVQNRSDKRDKADIRDTVLGLDFINALRPVDYRWDLREDYVERITEEVEVDGVSVVNMQVINHKQDGSRKRKRYHHGLIAQEVKEVIDKTGVDFGGYQDHSLAGGLERMTIGYDELIAPLIKAVQELSKEVEALKNR
jgi:hypothetical protein